jgi:hypothetical protein
MLMFTRHQLFLVFKFQANFVMYWLERLVMFLKYGPGCVCVCEQTIIERHLSACVPEQFN